MPEARDFGATLAHEIPNPLATNNLSLELMLAERKDDSLKLHTDIIRHSSDRIKELVNELIKRNCPGETQFPNQSLPHLQIHGNKTNRICIMPGGCPMQRTVSLLLQKKDR